MATALLSEPTPTTDVIEDALELLHHPWDLYAIFARPTVRPDDALLKLVKMDPQKVKHALEHLEDPKPKCLAAALLCGCPDRNKLLEALPRWMHGGCPEEILQPLRGDIVEVGVALRCHVIDEILKAMCG